MSAIAASSHHELDQLKQDSSIRNIIFHLKDKPWTDAHEQTRETTLTKVEGVGTKILTGDGRKIDAVWAVCPAQTKRTAILFHGNAMLLDGMINHALFFQARKFNVLMVTMGGYPGSEGSSTELTIYHDTAAAVNFVKKNALAKPEEIIAVGRSLGATFAMRAGSHHGTHALLDLPFGNLTKGIGELLWKPFSKLAGLETKAKKTFPKGISDGTHTTDGLNNVNKASIMGSGESKLLVIYAERDNVIPNPKKHATAIVSAYNETSNTKDGAVVPVDGNHQTAAFWNQKEVANRIDIFIHGIFQ